MNDTKFERFVAWCVIGLFSLCVFGGAFAFYVYQAFHNPKMLLIFPFVGLFILLGWAASVAFYPYPD